LPPDADDADRLAAPKHRRRQKAPEACGPGLARERVGPILEHVGNLHHRAGSDGPAYRAPLVSPTRKRTPNRVGVFGVYVLESGQVHQLAVVEPHSAVVAAAAAQPECAGRDDVEHRLGVGLGTADGAQHLAGGRLPGQGLGQLGVACLELPEQPHVLDGDDGLVSERLQQLDVLVREGAGIRPRVNRDGSDRDPIAKHGYGEHTPEVNPSQAFEGVVRVLAHVRNMEGLAGPNGSARRVPLVRRHRVRSP